MTTPATPAITANRVPRCDGRPVRVTGGHRSPNALAPGLIAARDQVGRFVGRQPAGCADRAVAHLLQRNPPAFAVAHLRTRRGVRIPLDAI
ncbi:hypothetical protein [Umezawaea beigongshangensis]|uniref:hypothetical protein n=1 Tax=Umezawaea beigongshangensis TaxID=2780383 RepID=UPI0018F1EE43|nr:hypothetical protein [Umezawaea beigongshangensis]